jgi:APA family basic amino acid/polyamine antiporter
MPVVPLIGVGFSLWLISFLDPQTWLRFGIWFLIGLVIWLVYGRRRSALARRS